MTIVKRQGPSDPFFHPLEAIRIEGRAGLSIRITGKKALGILV